MRYLLLLFLPLVALPVSADQDRGDSLAEASLASSATVQVLYVPAEGWAHAHDHGRLTGVTVEIMRGFAEFVEAEYGIELDLDFVEESDWTVFYQRVRDASDGVFGLGNVTITEARREELAFSPAYVNNVAVLITHDDVPPARAPQLAPDALDGLRALAFAGTLHEQRIEALRDRHWPQLEIDRARSNDEIIDKVSTGDYFAWIDGYNYHRARERGAPIRRHPVFDERGEEFGIIMPLENDWQPLLAEFLAGEDGLVGSPEYRELIARHLGEAVAEMLTD